MTLSRNSPIAPMSAKRRAELAAAGNPFPLSTLVPRAREPRGKPAPKAKRPADTGPDQATVDAVLERDGHSCVVCSGALHGTRSVDWSIHHRKRRSQGGDNSPANLISCCGHGTAGCHGAIHAAPAKARKAGWLLRRSDDPQASLMAHALHGYVFLTADGDVSTRRPTDREVAR